MIVQNFTLIDVLSTDDDGFDNRNSSSEDFHMTLKHAIVEVVSKVHYWKHYKPLLAMKSMKLLNSTVKEDCYDEPPKAVEEFPTDFLTSKETFNKFVHKI